METLTGKERLQRLFRGESLDRIPVSPRIHEFFIYEYFKSTEVDFAVGAVEVYRHFNMDIIDWNCTPSPHFELMDFTIEGPDWRPEIKYEKKESTTHEIATVTTPGGTLRRIISFTQITEYERETALTEYPIKSERDFELMVEYLPPVPKIDCSSITQNNELIGVDGITSPSIHGPFNILAYCLCKMEDLLLNIYLNPDFFHRMIEFMLDRIMKYAQQFIDAGGGMIDIGANIANARMVKADFLVEHILPYENRLADFIQNQGVPCLYHNCGPALVHLDIYDQLHHKIWGYVAPPPYGDTPMSEAVKRVPKDMILWGGIDQIDFLRQATPEQVEQHIKEVIEIVKPRGNYILGTTDYLETNTPYENIEAFVLAGHKYGRYDNSEEKIHFD